MMAGCSRGEWGLEGLVELLVVDRRRFFGGGGSGTMYGMHIDRNLQEVICYGGQIA